MTQRTCTHPRCSRKHDADGYCSTHNSRIRTHGDAYGKRCETCARPLEEVFATVRSQRYCGDDCRPRCAFGGCTRPVQKRDWCTSHYSQRKHGIDLRPVREWAPEGSSCKQCGDTVPVGIGRRATCSDACQALWDRYKGKRPSVSECNRCGVEFSTGVRLPSGALKRIDTRLCADCSKRRKFSTTVFAVAARHGTACNVCGEDVDMRVRRAESLFCPSIDHVLPRSRGGSDDMSNLRVAHFWCNAVKSDREGFTI